MRNRRKINNFYVFYRISDGAHKNAKFIDKIESLKNATSVFGDTNFIVFTDGLSEETEKQVHQICDNKKNVSFKHIDCKGNSKSFRYIYEEAIKLNNDDYVYFLEEDYLHLKESYKIMKEGAEWNYTDYITLYDHPDKYDSYTYWVNPYCKDMGEKTTLFVTPNRHWKVTNSTTMTFGAFVDVLKRDKEIFWKYTQSDIPSDFALFLELGKQKKLLSSPVPSLSTHCDLPCLSPVINWEEAKEEVKRDDIMLKNKSVCVVVCTHKETLSGTEEKSLLKCLEVFQKRDIKIVLPKSKSKEYYNQFKNKYTFDYVDVDDEWMKDSKSYSRMCCQKDFYELFKEYDYILIYQTDCWVYSDKLDYFMNLGYDWYGAPWPHFGDKVGNGGFCLRKVSKMLEITQKYTYGENERWSNEDTWFCLEHSNELTCCDLKNACNFSMECVNQKYFPLIDSIPMGLHGPLMEQHWDDSGDKFREFKKKYS